MHPVLQEDGSSMDWKDAVYELDVRIDGTAAEVRNVLRGASALIDLIEAGKASYALEIRCRKTLFARTHLSRSLEFRVDWRQDDVDGVVHLLAGVVANEPVTLPAEELVDLWSDAPGRQVPAGWWLARGSVYASEGLAASLIEFRRAADLENGRMRVAEGGSEEEPRFIVDLAPDVFARVRDRDVQIAGLIAACGVLPRSDRFNDEGSGNTVVEALRARIEDAGLPTWDQEDWDPARAATLLEPFAAVTRPDSAEDA